MRRISSSCGTMFSGTSLSDGISPIKQIHLSVRRDALAGTRLAPCFLADSFDQGFIYAIPKSRTRPMPIISIHCLPWRKVFGYHVPLATRAIHIQDGVDDFPTLPSVRTTQFICRKEFRNQHPFGVLQVGRVDLPEFGHSPSLLDYL